MRKLSVFNHITLDGYFTDKKGDMSWAHRQQDAEWNAFAAESASGGATLLFGRITYELMAGYWPTPQAKKAEPVIAKQMNELQKIVFSRSLDKVAWSNTKLLKGDLESEVQQLKRESGPDLMIFGSGQIISQLTALGLIDEYQTVVNPIVLGAGRTMFDGLDEKLSLKLTQTRAFGNGNVLLNYQRG